MDSSRQTRVGWLKSTNFQCSHCFVSFRSKVDVIVPYNDTPFWIAADTNKDDLECPIQIKAWWFTAKGVTKRSGAAKMKVLNGFLMIQRQITFKLYSVRKLRRSRMSDAFLADSVNMLLSSL